MKPSLQPYEKMQSPCFLDLPVMYTAQCTCDEETQRNMPDMNVLRDQDSLYLIRQRIENLREKVAMTFNEAIELQELENLTRQSENDAIPQNLGVASKRDKLFAALEAKRTNRYQDSYDGGEIEDSVSSENQSYQKLLEKSRLNAKSIQVLSSDKKAISNGKRPLSIFDLYDTGLAKLSFEQFLAKNWKMNERAVEKHLMQTPNTNLWSLKSEWGKYLDERQKKSPSPYQKILIRCRELVTSPIYDGMKEIREEQFALACGIEFRLTDLTAEFTIPISEFFDVPQKHLQMDNSAAFIQIAFTLPKCAQEKKRFFKKYGTVKELTTYLARMEVFLSEKQMMFLNTLEQNGVLRLYREVLELPTEDRIRGYFLNIRKGFQRWTKGFLQECIMQRLQQEKNILIRQVTSLSTWYPEWMQKIGGFIIERKTGEVVNVARSLRVSVDPRLSDLFTQARFLMPSKNLPQDKWNIAYRDELRKRWQEKPRLFEHYAKKLIKQEISLHCACPGNGVKIHHNQCAVPVLKEILEKIHNTSK